MKISSNQADKLGEQLRCGKIDADGLQKLNAYRASFAIAYAHVENVLTEYLKLKVTGRPSNSTIAIVEKLKRETIRLTQIQDIAGCRFLVHTLSDQDVAANNAHFWLPDTDFEDRRVNPSHGYRALHLISRFQKRQVEIQIRTRFQHAWAEISEKLADMYGQEVKYGRGPEHVKDFLGQLSVACEAIDVAYDKKLSYANRTYRIRLARSQDGRRAQKQLKELTVGYSDTVNKANKLIREFGKGGQ